jgi:Rad3-related DNA helicase
MWSLHEKKGGTESVEEQGKKLEPLKFSNGKSQEDVVKEILKAIEEGNKVIFVHGVCGTGKSAIALNLAKEIGKTSIVVPVKSLQKQYEEDYSNKKYLLKKDGEKLKIKVITGRQNHPCPFLQENELEIEGKDAKLDNYYKRNYSADLSQDESCDNPFLPCRIEIKDKNSKTIYNYLKKLPSIDEKYFSSLDLVSRRVIAPLCPYWSPILPVEMELNLEAKKRTYDGLNSRTFRIYQRKPGCGYCDQFQSYIDSDVLIFNSEKYKLETIMDRKPATELEVIDECDEFLDNLSNSKKINLNKLFNALGTLFSEHEKADKVINELTTLTRSFLNNPKIDSSIESQDILKLSETKIKDILDIFIDSDILDEVTCDEENYCFHVDEVARTFKNMSDETYVTFTLEDRDIFARLVTINLEKRFSEFIEKNKILVLMSGTIHSQKVLKDVFGLKNFKIIEAETKLPGTLRKIRTGQEFSCKYENFQKGFVTRKKYLLALQGCIQAAKKPCLVNVTAFSDLPTEHELKAYGLDMMTQEKLNTLQKDDKTGKNIQEFKQGKQPILYSTKCNRGVDFPGEICNSIVITRYPYPNISSLFWKILQKTRPEYYMELYMDKSKREFLQRIYRALRSKDDEVYLLSPDIRVLMAQV